MQVGTNVKTCNYFLILGKLQIQILILSAYGLPSQVDTYVHVINLSVIFHFTNYDASGPPLYVFPGMEKAKKEKNNPPAFWLNLTKLDLV